MTTTQNERKSILDIFDAARTAGASVRFAAPMVRYSKLPFRLLVRRHGVDVAYTPMIMADSFHRSGIARDCEFQTCPEDRPLVMQFAASNAADFRRAAELVAPHVDGIDLNCGCPQSWAQQEQVGAYWMTGDWDVLADMLKQAREAAGGCPISTKIRILDDPRKIVEMARRLQAAGVSWITVHGRTKHQRSSEPVNYEIIRLVKENVRIPVVANGNVFTAEDAVELQHKTGVDGVMAARGLLENPVLFEGPMAWPVVDEFLGLAIDYGLPTALVHHHLSTMMTRLLPANRLRHFNALTSMSSLLDFLDANRPF